MATFDYAGTRSTAERLLKKFGQSGAVRRTTVTGGDPFDPETETNDYTVTLVVTQYSLRERESDLIGVTDRRAIISTEGVSIPAIDAEQPETEDTPTDQDQLVVDGKAYAVKRVDPLNPGGTVLLWEAQVTF